MEKYYLNLLCRTIEKCFGSTIHTTEEFARLSDDIHHVTGERLSVSTLKICWGRVSSDQTRRVSTLSILAAYAGYKDWNTFITTIRTDMVMENTTITRKEMLWINT